MKNITPIKIVFVFILLVHGLTFAQDEREPLMGKVMYRNVNIEGMNVINVTAETVQTTDENGEFAIDVKPNDMLVFTSLNYELTSVEITQTIIDNGRLVVEVNEKITELDEIVLSPEDQEKFIDAKSEEFAAYNTFSYEKDDATKIDNPSLPTQVRGLQNGLNFANIAKLLFRKRDKDAKEEEELPQLKLSEIMLQVYDIEFFVIDLKIPQDKVQEFVYYLDSQSFSRELLKKDQEFLFVDWLVEQSKNFKEQLEEPKE